MVSIIGSYLGLGAGLRRCDNDGASGWNSEDAADAGNVSMMLGIGIKGLLLT